jgi:hypothetical protein
MSKFSKGDQLVTNVDIAGLTEHHGVYVGNNLVIHFSAERDEIIETDLFSFSAGNEIRIKRSAPNPSEAVRRAKDNLGRNGYNVMTNNCEQFVNNCIKKQQTSNQVSNVGHIAVQVAARQGILGSSLSKLVLAPASTVVLTSTLLKATGEYVGFSEEVNTIVGAPGDMVAKPIETVITGLADTAGKTYDRLNDGDIIDAAGELLGGTIKTAVDAALSPLYVAGNVLDALISWRK